MLAFKDLMSLVGQFLFRWSAMEQELTRSILSAEGQTLDLSFVKGTLSERLRRWEGLQVGEEDRRLAREVTTQIEKLRTVRNLIVHGLAGGHSRPDDGTMPHIKCMEGRWQNPTGDMREITAGELEHYIEAADACWRGLMHPNNFTYRL